MARPASTYRANGARRVPPDSVYITVRHKPGKSYPMNGKRECARRLRTIAAQPAPVQP